MLSKPWVTLMEEKRSFSSESEMEYGSRSRTQMAFQLEESSYKMLGSPKLGIVRPISENIIDISDSENETEATPKENSSNKFVKGTSSNRKGEEIVSSCEEKVSLASALKRKRASKKVTSSSDSDDDDLIPIGKLKMKKLEELGVGVLNHSDSSANQCGLAPAASCGGENVEGSLTPSRRQLISLRQCEEKRRGPKQIPSNHFKMSGSSSMKLGNPVAGNVVEVVRSNSKDESLGGFCVNGSDGSNREANSIDPEHTKDGISEFLRELRRSKASKLKWQCEVDMLSSLEADPVLCMRAVCALYRQHTSEEKPMKGSLHFNDRGFNTDDAIRGTILAEFLLDRNREGDIKKSVNELELNDPKGLEECKKLARYYSKQLYIIYQKKEDPFFPLVREAIN